MHKAVILSLGLLLTACSPPQAPAPATPAPTTTPTAVGGDRDAHGCIGSAGYAWCARSAACERPWELAEREGIENTAPAVEAWCAAPADAPQPGDAPVR
ncbi:peptidase [Luteimonas sp. S4-F44]|uniref:peptidase n=1 Tax=Luteimonas sp. S4-F44 TaxID=2925842 RepID=UPI001F52BE85|nr:peptidase [Luteimonas sp. S4-F44]UNK42158.1 peptidase [Luteimonas sp. S4-F44]